MTSVAGARQSPLGHIGQFSFAQALLVVGPLVLLPILARHASTGEWVALATGQSAGTVAALVVAAGWSLNGPARVAERPEAHAGLLADSLRDRLWAGAFAVPIGAIAAAAITPSSAGLAAAVAGAAALTGLSPSWYAVVRRDPGILLKYDVAPTVLGVVAAAVVVALGASPFLYPASIAISRFASTWRLWTTKADFAARPRSGGVRLQFVATASEVLGGAYSAASPALVSLGAPLLASAAYASGWRVFAVSLVAIVVIAQAMQGWAFEQSEGRASRLRLSLLALGVVGLAGGVVLALSLPWLTTVMFGARLATSRGAAVAFGLAFLAVSLSTGLGRMQLIALDRARDVLTSTAAGTVVGVPATLIGASRFAETGGAVGFAASEVLVVLVQSALLYRARTSSWQRDVGHP